MKTTLPILFFWAFTFFCGGVFLGAFDQPSPARGETALSSLSAERSCVRKPSKKARRPARFVRSKKRGGHHSKSPSSHR